jgi:diguanylate cyclase (GGDEF)-like protein
LYYVLDHELRRSKKSHAPLSLAFLDLDRFKLVNDAHGHLVGSELLTLTGRRLQELSRKQDVCFRYGGDEFVILMPQTDAETALELTKAMHRALMDTQFRMKNGLKLNVSASVGLASAPGDGVQVHAIIGTADARMYSVKSDGRGRVRGA